MSYFSGKFMTDIIDCINSFVRDNPEITIGLAGLLFAALGIMLTVNTVSRNRINRFYDKLEADSLCQINENLKNIERILRKTIKGNDNLTLYDILDRTESSEDIYTSSRSFESLSPYFAEYCANLDKYNSNIIPRKKICFNFQEHGKKARAILSMFQKYDYEDISLGFAKLHLKSAGIIENS